MADSNIYYDAPRTPTVGVLQADVTTNPATVKSVETEYSLDYFPDPRQLNSVVKKAGTEVNIDTLYGNLATTPTTVAEALTSLLSGPTNTPAATAVCTATAVLADALTNSVLHFVKLPNDSAVQARLESFRRKLGTRFSNEYAGTDTDTKTAVHDALVTLFGLTSSTGLQDSVVQSKFIGITEDSGPYLRALLFNKGNPPDATPTATTDMEHIYDQIQEYNFEAWEDSASDTSNALETALTGAEVRAQRLCFQALLQAIANFNAVSTIISNANVNFIADDDPIVLVSGYGPSELASRARNRACARVLHLFTHFAGKNLSGAAYPSSETMIFVPGSSKFLNFDWSKTGGDLGGLLFQNFAFTFSNVTHEYTSTGSSMQWKLGRRRNIKPQWDFSAAVTLRQNFILQNAGTPATTIPFAMLFKHHADSAVADLTDKAYGILSTKQALILDGFLKNIQGKASVTATPMPYASYTLEQTYRCGDVEGLGEDIGDFSLANPPVLINNEVYQNVEGEHVILAKNRTTGLVFGVYTGSINIWETANSGNYDWRWGREGQPRRPFLFHLGGEEGKKYEYVDADMKFSAPLKFITSSRSSESKQEFQIVLETATASVTTMNTSSDVFFANETDARLMIGDTTTNNSVKIDDLVIMQVGFIAS